MKLFDSIKPLFAKKPLIIVANKADIVKINELPAERKKFLSEIENDPELTLMEMSTVNDEGVMEVKTEACERLLSFRVDQKMRTKKVLNLIVWVYFKDFICRSTVF